MAEARTRLTRWDLLAATVLGVGYFAALAATSSGIGYVRDEGHYFRAAEVYNRWFEALWDDIAVVRLRSGRTIRAPLIRGDRESGVVLRQRAGRLVIPPERIAHLQVQPNPQRKRVFDKRFIDSIWRENSEHPVLMKVLFVLSWRVFYEKLGWTNQGDAFRIPAWFFGGLLLFLVYLFGTELYDRRAGLYAALTVGLMPHVFYHAHLACFDVPMVTLWLAVIYCFWKSQVSLYWGITAGGIFALALATKHNAFFLPFILVAYWLASRWRELGFPRVDGVRRFRLPPLPVAFLSMLVIAPILYYAHWPWIWNDPIAKLGRYLGYHMHHEHYPVPYLGKILYHPPFPWHFPFVMSFFTVPEMTVLLGGVGFCLVAAWQVPWAWLAGLADRWRRWRERARARRAPGAQEQAPNAAAPDAALPPATAPPVSPPATTEPAEPLFPYRARRLYPTDQVELLLLLGCFVPFAVIAHPKTPIFGGTKHWMQGMPFVALFAAVGLHFALSRLATWRPALARRPNLLWGAVAALTLAPTTVALVRSHPFGTSYHNLFAGGLNGAARLGNTWQFWGGAFRNVADWLNRHAERGAGICHHLTNSKGWVFYQRDHLVRSDLVGLTGLGRECRFAQADYYVYQHQPEYQGDEVQTWQRFGTIFPVHVVALDGMPLVSVYKKPVRLRPGGTVLYGRRTVGAWRREGDAVHLEVWRSRQPTGRRCAGVWRGGHLERAGQAAVVARDADDAFRTLNQGCFGSRLPR